MSSGVNTFEEMLKQRRYAMSSGVNTFEEMLKQLQEIVTRLESGNLSLSETLDLYEQGIHIAGACQQILDQAELRVTTLNNTMV